MTPVPQNQQQNQQTPPPPPPEPKYRFRWPILAVVLAVMGFFWVLNGVTPSFRFDDVLELLNVVQRGTYTQLACLGVVVIAVTLIIKTLKK